MDGAALYSPLDYRPADLAWGFTAREAHTHNPLAVRLARELPDTEAEVEWDGLGNATTTDGELLDDEVGDIRAGWLAFSEPDNPAAEADFWATGLGIDSGAASPEEAIVHVATAPYA